MPETLHFPNTGGLEIQVTVYLIKGVLSKPGSIYGAQSVVKQVETGKVVYNATGSFILDPIKFLAHEFHLAIAIRNFEALWDKLDGNGELMFDDVLFFGRFSLNFVSLRAIGDGIVSREELQQFVRSSGMKELDEKKFDTLFNNIDTDNSGELSYAELTKYSDSLHLGTIADFGKFIINCLNCESTDSWKAVTNLWEKLDIDGDGVVSLEELELFIKSQIPHFSGKDIGFLHQAIDSDSDGVISFSEFKSYLRSIKSDMWINDYLFV